MLSKREELVVNQIKINEFKKKARDLQSSIDELHELNINLIPQIMEEEAFLYGSKWVLKIGKTLIPYLEYYGSASDKLMKEIVVFTQSYHAHLPLEDGIYLQLDNEKVLLHFDELQDIFSFSKRKGIVINAEHIKNTLKQLQSLAEILI